MKQKTNLFKIVLTITSIAFLSLSCGGGGGGGGENERVTLTVWKTFEDSQNLREIFQAYKKLRPNVDIVYTKKNVETYEEDLLNALASGTGPDIFSIHNSWLPKYLDKVAEAPPDIWQFTDYKNDFVDVAVSDFTKDGKIYAAPMSVDSLALYYNKDLMGTVGIATPPKTWSNLEDDVRALKRSDSKGYFTRSGVAIGSNSNVNRAVDILYLFMLQKGVVPFSQYGQPNFAGSVYIDGNYTNPGEEALNFYISFALPSSLNYNWNLRSDYSVDAFANGRAAYLISYSYMRDTILQKAPNLNFDVAPVPQPDLQNPSVNFANYWGEAVSKQSKHADYAWDFIKFLTGRESLDMYYAKVKQPSSRKDLVELQISDPDIGVFAHANLTAKNFFRPDQVKMDAIFGKAIDNMILSGFSSQEALGQAQQQTSALLRE